MTFKNWLLDVYLTFCYGKWEVRRLERTVTRSFDDFSVQLKAEGTEVCYDPSVKCDYYACCNRTGDMILCGSRREAEGFVAIKNDMRKP